VPPVRRLPVEGAAQDRRRAPAQSRRSPRLPVLALLHSRRRSPPARPLLVGAAGPRTRPEAEVVGVPPRQEAAEAHSEVVAGPRQEAGAAWVPPRQEGVAASGRQAVAAAGRQAGPAASPRQGEAGAWVPREAAAAWHRVGPAAWARREASVGHPHPEAWAVRPSRAASAGHRFRPAVAVHRRPDGRAGPAWASPPGHRGRRRPGTAPTGCGRTSRASAAPLPPRVPPRGRGRVPPSPPSTPGTRRTSRRTRRPPCCGSHRICTRSRPVHLHSVHDVRRLGGGHRRVDQVHGHARRVVHPDPHGQPR
jgi:hypothetical protein